VVSASAVISIQQVRCVVANIFTAPPSPAAVAAAAAAAAAAAEAIMSHVQIDATSRLTAVIPQIGTIWFLSSSQLSFVSIH